MLAGIGGQHPMTRPLSNDLRERVVAAIVGGESCRSVASRFGVAVSSVVKWSQRYRATGSVAPGEVGGRRKRVLEPHRAFVLERIGQTPHLTLHGLQANQCLSVAQKSRNDGDFLAGALPQDRPGNHWGSRRPPRCAGAVIGPTEWSSWNVSLRLAWAPAWPADPLPQKRSRLLSTVLMRAASTRVQSSLPSDLDDLDAGLLGARDHVAGAATAGKGQYDIWLLVEHHLIALRPGRGAPLLPVGRHADESDFLGGGLPVSPFACPLVGTGRTALDDR